MPSSPNPAAPIQLTREQARRYLLVHQRLLPPRQLMDKAGILDFVEHVGCIQFDPVNIVGRNPDLVLQARIANYQSTLLEEALYQDHLLMDGWDKLASIHLTRDWPYFERHRRRMADLNSDRSRPEIALADEILRQMRLQGEYDPSQSKSRETIVWNWGRPVRMERPPWKSYMLMARLEFPAVLAAVGFTTSSSTWFRRKFLPPKTPIKRWMITMTGMSCAALAVWADQSGSSDFWLGIQHAKAPQRAAAIARLLAKGDLIQLEIIRITGKASTCARPIYPSWKKPGLWIFQSRKLPSSAVG